jgi:DNA polymerase III alpha subunit
MVAPLHNTDLKDRVLWFDGQSSFKSADLLTAIQHYDIKYVDVITPIVKEYNNSVDKKQQEIKVKTSCDPLSHDWVLPAEYKRLNVEDYVFNKHDKLLIGLPTPEVNDREYRLTSELLAFEKRGLLDVVRALIYIINTLNSNKVVWGIGRGSSVSSYVLYVLGVHDVDSYAYDLDIGDFLHD